jgi:ACS family hexuronate transporter-like MFS transporter
LTPVGVEEGQLCTAWWSTAAVLHSLTRGPWSRGLFRFLLGAGEAGNWPAAAKVAAEWFPAEQRALASGIFNSGAAVGAILSMFLAPRVVLLVGWRMAFVVIGALGYLWLAVWWFVYPTPANAPQEISRAPDAPWRVLLFVGCGIMPLVALSILLFVMGPLRPHPDFHQPSGDVRSAQANHE